MTLPKYNLDNYEDIYTVDAADIQDTQEEQIERWRDKRFTRYRVKTIRSGPMLECEIYPVTPPTPGRKRAKKQNNSRSVQRNLNDKNAQKHVNRLVQVNFKKDDLWLTYTYDDDRLPDNLQQAKKDMQNQVRRMKHYMKKHGLGELKYIYVTEYRSATGRAKKRVHHHMISDFPDREKAEELWSKGRANSRRLKPNDKNLEEIGSYIAKDKTARKNKQKQEEERAVTSKSYTPSRNLKQPTVTIADSKVTRRRAQKIADDPNMAHEIFEKLYKDYKYCDMQVRYSPYMAGAYIYVQMRRTVFPNNRRTKQDE